MFFHGSTHKIEKFTDEFVGGQKSIDADGPGIYFTSSWDDARQFGSIIYSVNLSPRKIVYDKPGKIPQKDLMWLIKQSGDWESRAQNWDENPQVGLMKSINAIYEYYDTPFRQLLQIYKEYYNDSIFFVKNSSQLKYDAIYLEKEWGATHVVVLNPSIIELVKVEDDRTDEEKQKLNEIRKLVRKTLTNNLNDNFKNWFAGSKVVNKDGSPMVVHHGTSKKFSKFSFKNAPQKIIWFTSNKVAVDGGEVGAAGKGHVIDLYASIKNPAGWDEYEKYGLGQLQSMGYDGAILPDSDGTITGFVFDGNKLKSVANKGEWNPANKSIFKEEETNGIKTKDIIIKKDLVVYHGADESNIEALEKGFSILSPEEKMKLPSTGGGYFGFSASVNIDKAAKYSSVFGSKVVIELKLLKGAKIKGIYNDGRAIDEVLTQEEIEEYSHNGYDAILELQEGGEEEVRILKSDKVKIIKVISLDKNIVKEDGDGRTLGKSLADQNASPYVVIYRAAPMTAHEFFDKDYVTLSKKFAIEHAENNHVYHEEPYHVIQALVPSKDVYDAYNPGEYFYSGPNKKAKQIYISKGPDEYEGLDESTVSPEYNKPFRFYLMCDELCDKEGVEVKNKMIADATKVSKRQFITNCAHALQLIKNLNNMSDDPGHGYYKSNLKGVDCYYLQYAGFEFIFLKDFAGGKEKFLDENVLSENNTELWVNGGILLIKGKPTVDNLQFLYAVHIVDLKELPRTKVDNTAGKSAKMAILDNNLYIIVMENGMLKAMKADTRTLGSLSRTMKFNGRQVNAVTLNNNKTPIHWETLKYNNFPTLFQKAGSDIQQIPNIKLTL